MFIPTTKIKVTRLLKTGESLSGEDILEQVEVYNLVPADLQAILTQMPVKIAGQTVLAEQTLFCGREIKLKENDTIIDLGNDGDNDQCFKVLSVNVYGLIPHIEALLKSGTLTNLEGVENVGL